MILEIILFVLLIIISFLFYRQDKTISKQIEYIDSIELKLLNTFESIKKALDDIKEIDEKGGFESDDEVGQIFSNIKDVITKLDNEINYDDES
tara:strand:- start:633 stop:911 length:279 start_codon:yes stop_codon:yes gene_type:complete